jgi:hypothetical protein
MMLVLFTESSRTSGCASLSTSGFQPTYVYGNVACLSIQGQMQTHPLMSFREIARGLGKQRATVHTPEAMNLSILSF